MKTLIITVICLTTFAACSGNGNGNGNGKTDIGSEGAAVEGPAAVAQRIVGEHTGTDYKQVEVLSVESVDFSDSSLGCPQPGMAYIQVITPGHKVMTTASGPEGAKKFDVRVAGSNGLICNNRNQEQPRR